MSTNEPQPEKATELVAPGTAIEAVGIPEDDQYVIALPETASQWIACDREYAVPAKDQP